MSVSELINFFTFGNKAVYIFIEKLLMKVLFHENQLSYRGTTNALFDYAYFNQKILKNESLIIYNRNNKNNFQKAIERFEKFFRVISYEDVSELEPLIKKEAISLFYAIKSGKKDDVMVTNCKMAVHVVFKHYEPHGDVYAYVSKWLSNEMTKGRSPFVPHMIHVEDSEEDLREELGIPRDAIVFGRHGGKETFDLKFMQKVVYQIAEERKDVYFLFLGTKQFKDKRKLWRFSREEVIPKENVLFLPSTIDKLYISKFINTCDAYLHARKQGESFGIAVGEFSVKNKPVITWSGSKEKSHIKILGEKAILYANKKEAYSVLNEFKKDTATNWDAYSELYSPSEVMRKFKEVFID